MEKIKLFQKALGRFTSIKWHVAICSKRLDAREPRQGLITGLKSPGTWGPRSLFLSIIDFSKNNLHPPKFSSGCFNRLFYARECVKPKTDTVPQKTKLNSGAIEVNNANLKAGNTEPTLRCAAFSKIEAVIHYIDPEPSQTETTIGNVVMSQINWSAFRAFSPKSSANSLSIPIFERGWQGW